MGTAPDAAELTRRAERGAALMDRHDPNWAILVDVGILDVSLLDLCPLGQYFEDYRYGALTLGLVTENESTHELTSSHPLVTHGFDLTSDEMSDEDGKLNYNVYRPLTDAWRRLVHERARRGVVPTPVSGT